MNKVIAVLLSLAIVFSMIACSGTNETTTKVQEEENQTAISGEENDKSIEENAEETTEEIIEEKPKGPSLLDKEKVAEFVIDEVLERPISVDEFINRVYTFEYDDVNDDGKEELILFPDGWRYILVLAEGEDNYQILMQQPGAKYLNDAKMKDGFLMVTQKTGGTGVAEVYIDLWKWDGQKMQKVLEGLTAEYVLGIVGPEPKTVELFGEINGPLTDFDYTLMKRVQEGESEPVENLDAHARYTWHSDRFEFRREELMEDAKGSIELVRGKHIDYAQWGQVVIADYHGRYVDKLDTIEYEHPDALDPTASHTIAVFGTIKNVRLVYTKFESEGGEIGRKDELSNTMITIKGYEVEAEKFVLLEFEDEYGNQHVLPLTDEEIDPYMQAYIDDIRTDRDGIIRTGNSGINLN